MWQLSAVILLIVTGAATPQQPPQLQPLAITTEFVPKAILRQEYHSALQAAGGQPPLHWTIEAGAIPPGVNLDENSGVLSGIPSSIGEYHFTLSVTDSGKPARSVRRDFTLKVVAPLTLEWASYPRVEGARIYGSVKLSNATGDEFDLTLIVLAVNEVGKAFTLGYQRLSFQPNSENLEIPFGSTLPRGKYTIHADAIAEIEAKRIIHRSRLQTPQPLEVTAP